MLWYTLDVIQRFEPGARFPTTTDHARRGLLANLVDHVVDGVPLLVPAASTGAFMRVLEAVRTGPPPTPIDPAFVDRRVGDEGTHRVVRDLEAWSARVVTEGRTFAELGRAVGAERLSRGRRRLRRSGAARTRGVALARS